MTNPLKNQHTQLRIDASVASQQTMIEINEEQLHTITGGCGQCQRDNQEINRLADRADEQSRLALVAKEMGEHELALHHSNQARVHALQALVIRHQMRARMSEPGHRN